MPRCDAIPPFVDWTAQPHNDPGVIAGIVLNSQSPLGAAVNEFARQQEARSFHIAGLSWTTLTEQRELSRRIQARTLGMATDSSWSDIDARWSSLAGTLNRLGVLRPEDNGDRAEVFIAWQRFRGALSPKSAAANFDGEAFSRLTGRYYAEESVNMRVEAYQRTLGDDSERQLQLLHYLSMAGDYRLYTHQRWQPATGVDWHESSEPQRRAALLRLFQTDLAAGRIPRVLSGS